MDRNEGFSIRYMYWFEFFWVGYPVLNCELSGWKFHWNVSEMRQLDESHVAKRDLMTVLLSRCDDFVDTKFQQKRSGNGKE